MLYRRPVQLHFTPREDGPEQLVSDAEIYFEEGPLAGTRLSGFCLWRNSEGKMYVTLPSRAKGAGADRRYFGYLRSVDDKTDAVRRVKAWIIEEYRKRTGDDPGWMLGRKTSSG
jgi:hypothetical protein